MYIGVVDESRNPLKRAEKGIRVRRGVRVGLLQGTGR